MFWSPYALGTPGCRMLLEPVRTYGLGMEALVVVCSWNTYRIMVSMEALVIVCSWNMYGITEL